MCHCCRGMPVSHVITMLTIISYESDLVAVCVRLEQMQQNALRTTEAGRQLMSLLGLSSQPSTATAAAAAASHSQQLAQLFSPIESKVMRYLRMSLG